MIHKSSNHHRQHAVDLEGNDKQRAYRQLLHSASSSIYSTPRLALRVHHLALAHARRLVQLVCSAWLSASDPASDDLCDADSARTFDGFRHSRAIHPRKPPH